MTSTYDPTLPTDKDWIRFLIGDRGTVVSGQTITDAVLADEEINGVVGEEANKYLAAARCGQTIIAQMHNLSSKTVDGLNVAFAQGRYSTYGEHIAALREKGARLLLNQSGSHILRSI